MKLYISASDASIAGLLVQDEEKSDGRTIEHAIFYLSRTLLDTETKYSPIEKLCLALYFAGCKLRHYMISFTTRVVAQTDLVKYMLTRPILHGRIGKWILALSEFSLQYVPLKAQTSQSVTEFLLHHPVSNDYKVRDLEIGVITIAPWTLYFDGSRTEKLAGAGIALENPEGVRFAYSFQLEWN